MSCYHPSFIHRITNRSTGEVTTHFIGSEESKRYKECQDTLTDKYTGNKSLDILYRNFDDSFGFKALSEFIQIPCGKCIGCRIDYSRSWADRLTYHSLTYPDNAWFITLTYDDIHLDDLDHSVNYDVYALNFEHMSKFIKRLRNKFRDCQIDYFYSGEYGDSSFRPHFHMIVYNLPLIDLEFWKLDDQCQPIYTSETIHSLWENGICSISEFNWRNAAYTASYVEKKRDGRLSAEYSAVGLTPESCRMSRRPGIAYEYYQAHADSIWNNNGLNVSRDVNSSGHLGIPRYFRKLAEDGQGYDAFKAWQQRMNDKGNLLNPLSIDNSSFDLARVRSLLEFQEKNILSRKVNKKL